MALLPTHPPALAALALLGAGLAALAWRRFPMSYTMALLILGVFLVQLLSQSLGLFCELRITDPHTPRPRLVGDCVTLELGFVAPLALAGEQVLTPFTYMFVHAGLLHLAGNLFILLTAGPALEERVGPRRFLAVYLLAGLGAAASTVVLWRTGYFRAGEQWLPNVGASGAIFGILTGFALIAPRERLPMILPMTFFVFWMPAMTVLLLYLAIQVVYVFSEANVAWWGHVAGFLVGVAASPLLARQLPARAPAAARIDAAALEPLATSDAQRAALREIARLQEGGTRDDARLAELWLERFAARAHCPACHHRLEVRGGSLVCPRGDYEARAVKG